MKELPLVSACLVLTGLVVGIPNQTQDSGLTPEQAEILSHLSLEPASDEEGGNKTLVVRGVDVKLVGGDLVHDRPLIPRPRIVTRKKPASCAECAAHRVAVSKLGQSP